MIHQLLCGYHRIRYHLLRLLQSILAQGISRCCFKYRKISLSDVTIFISSFNTLPALKITLKSLEAHTDIRQSRLVIADNASTDGSKEFLEKYASSRPWVDLIKSNELKLHGHWMDQQLRLCKTRYWMAIDSDIEFFAPGVIEGFIGYMEENPECALLAADPRPGGLDQGKCNTYCEESISSWLFCVRTSLNTKVSESYVVVYPHQQPEENGNKIVSDTGAKVLRKMRELGIRYDFIPWWIRIRFYHYGGMSWIYMVKDQNRWIELKRYQQRDLEKRSELIT